MARPKMPEDRKKEAMSISVSKEAKAIAMASGNASEYIEQAIRQKDANDKNKAKKRGSL